MVQVTHSADLEPSSKVAIDKEYLSRMLCSLGVDMSQPLAPSFILGSFDIMASAELASRLPQGANFEAVLQEFHTLKHVQPPVVRKVQARVLDLVRRLCAPMSEERYQAIQARLQFSGCMPEL